MNKLQQAIFLTLMWVLMFAFLVWTMVKAYVPLTGQGGFNYFKVCGIMVFGWIGWGMAQFGLKGESK